MGTVELQRPVLRESEGLEGGPFHPSRFGMGRLNNGWVKEFPGVGRVVFSTLSWEHVSLMTGSQEKPQTSLDFLRNLQQETFGFDPQDLVPFHVFSIIPATGGSTIVAYDENQGLTNDGWRGFIFGFGSSHGRLVSHQAGVREDLRGKADIGWYLKILQAHEALKSGHTSIEWTFDPMRSLNAALNLGKLGAIIETFTLDKYGALKSELYGEVPTDRFTALWHLQDPRTVALIEAVRDGKRKKTDLQELNGVPRVDIHNVAQILSDRPELVLFEIPGDIDVLMKEDPSTAVELRRNMRQILSQMMTTEQKAFLEETQTPRPDALITRETEGPYYISSFVSGFDDNAHRRSFYVLEKKGNG